MAREVEQEQLLFGRKMKPCSYIGTPAQAMGKTGCIVVKAYPNKEIEAEHII